ncbi:hypothetical protein PHISCL_01449 [Aspergillus sclerotialis]|uniref:Integral membrane protein n=1 Tax=Aspergillus sclerotialis TaxID=2070753 RepID=A0A3A3AA27_9EURO|nr:hypothetical protein PHISCL_01449 [Aspergillus sclerotialis]
MPSKQGQPAILGGHPTKTVDVPICSVFLFLFLLGAIFHMTVFQVNRRRGHKFIPSVVTFGFCMSRIAANIVRIAWAVHPTSQGLAIAAQILVAAGVVLLFILNLLFTQRMLRATHPTIGWARPVSWTFKAVYIFIVICIIMVITVVVQSFNTTNPNTLRIDHDIQLAAVTYITVVSFLPLPLLVFILLFPNRLRRIESFGTGSWYSKIILVALTSILLCLGASFRAGTTWLPSRPAIDPPWYVHKACFYVFNFSLEITVVAAYLVGRIDRRFYVPDGSSKVRHYRPRAEVENESEGRRDSDEDLDGVVGDKEKQHQTNGDQMNGCHV